MDTKRYLLFFLMLIFLASSSAIIYYLIKANFYTNSNLFWIGAIAGFLGCLFLVSVSLLLFFFVARGVTAKKYGLLFSMLILSALGVVVIYKGPFSLDSDIWWYGAIAGFLSCLSLISFILAIFIGYRLTHKINLPNLTLQN